MNTVAQVGKKFRDRDRYPEHAVAAYLLLTSKLQGISFSNHSFQVLGEERAFWDLLKKELTDSDTAKENMTLPSDWNSFLKLDKDQCNAALELLRRFFPKG